MYIPFYNYVLSKLDKITRSFNMYSDTMIKALSIKELKLEIKQYAILNVSHGGFPKYLQALEREYYIRTIK